ncbi:MAG: hypothetical protein ACW99G_01525 [Candidatus Thorarchaeota archaeon]
MKKMKRLPRGGKKVNYTLYISEEQRQNIKYRAKKLNMTDAYYLMRLYEMDISGDLMPHFENGCNIVHVVGSNMETEVREEDQDWEEPVDEDELSHRGEYEQQIDPQQFAEIEITPYNTAEFDPENVAMKPGQTMTTEQMEKAQASVADNLRNAPRQDRIELPPEKPVQDVSQRKRIRRPKMKSMADVIAEETGVPVVGSTTTNPVTARNPGTSDAQQRAARLSENWQEDMHKAVQADRAGERAMRRQILDNLPQEE